MNWLLQDRQFKHDKEMFLLQNRSGSTVKGIMEEMLNHKTHIERSFKALTSRVGGFSDDELRQFLHELGAQKIDKDGEERWYLLSRREERLARSTK